MIKQWISKALKYLEHSLIPVPQELNEIDWKEELSPNNKKLCRHLSAFANHPGGGFLVFGIEDKSGRVQGIGQEQAELIMQKLSSLCRTSVFPLVSFGPCNRRIQRRSCSVGLYKRKCCETGFH